MSLAETATIKPRWPWWPLACLLAVTLLVRGGALLAMPERLRDDPDAYRQIAQGWLATGVYTLDLPLDATTVPQGVAPTAFRPPLYPLVLTNLAWHRQIAPWSIGVLHLVLGVLTVLLLYRLGLDWGLRQWSLLAALLVACDPILINQSVLVMTETLATLLAVVGLWQLTRFSQRRSFWNALLAGAALGLAALCRPTFLPWAGLVVLSVLAASGSGKQRLGYGLTVVIGLALLLAPWAVRNYQQFFQRPMVTTTHGGYTLWLANNPLFYEYLREGDTSVAWLPSDSQLASVTKRAPREIQQRVLDSLPAQADLDTAAQDRRLRELYFDRLYAELAWDAIEHHPSAFVGSCVARTYYLWSPLPQKISPDESSNRAAARYLTAVWYLGVYLLALAGLWRLRWQLWNSPWVWGILLCLAVTAVHAVYFSNLRMRAPLMPVVALLAAAGVVRGTATIK